MQIKNYYYNGCKRCLLMGKGKLNRITDVEGVLVGHKTISSGTHQTGVTFIRTAEDVFHQKLACGGYFGKLYLFDKYFKCGCCSTSLGGYHGKRK